MQQNNYKIKIARRLLKCAIRDYLKEHGKTFRWSAMNSELGVFNRYLKDKQLTEAEIDFLEEVMEWKEIRYGKYVWREK